MKIQKERRFNCLFGVIYLLFRGKIVKIGVLVDVKTLWYHFIGIDKKGRMFHFKRSSRGNFWFKGKYQIVNKKATEKIISKKRFITLW